MTFWMNRTQKEVQNSYFSNKKRERNTNVMFIESFLLIISTLELIIGGQQQD